MLLTNGRKAMGKCPHCASPIVVKNGFDAKTGKQRYKCCVCQKVWQPYQKVDTTIPCTDCGNKAKKRGKYPDGKQRYFCEHCRRSVKDAPRESRLPCYYCGQPTKKNGLINGKQRYFCTPCQKYVDGDLVQQIMSPIKWYS